MKDIDEILKEIGELNNFDKEVIYDALKEHFFQLNMGRNYTFGSRYGKFFENEPGRIL